MTTACLNRFHAYLQREHGFPEKIGRRRLVKGFAFECLFIVAFYLLYQIIRIGLGDVKETAMRNAQIVISIETMGFLDKIPEYSLQQLFCTEIWQINLFNFVYMNAHFIVFAVVFVTAFTWSFFKGRMARYRHYRNIFFIANIASLVLYYLVPVAPPRLATGYMIDTLAMIIGYGTVDGFTNLYAAFPSIHALYPMFYTYVAFKLCRSKVPKAAALSLAILMLFTIVVTANHYFIDILGALVVLAATVHACDNAWPWVKKNLLGWIVTGPGMKRKGEES